MQPGDNIIFINDTYLKQIKCNYRQGTIIDTFPDENMYLIEMDDGTEIKAIEQDIMLMSEYNRR